MNKLSTMVLILAAVMLQATCKTPSKPGRSIKDDADSQKTAEKKVSFDNGQLIKRMEIKSGQTDTIFISVHQGDSIRIRITTPSDTANIRISQLFSPNGSADGPFGKELTYHFVDSGRYYITVNENRMVGNRYTGPYEVEIIPI